MKKLAGSIIILILLSFNSILIAQGEAALPFLSFPTSPMNASMGSVGTSLPTDNVYGFLYNPAQLGYTSQFTNFGFQFYLKNPVMSRLYSQYNTLAEINSIALNLGYNFNKILNIPISIGLGYSNSEFKIESPVYYNDDKDNYSAYSIGIGADYFIQFSFGFTYKSISSNLSQYSIRTINNGSGASAIDVGFLINVPVSKLIDQDAKPIILGNIPILPSLDFSVGYAQTNIGDKVYYVDKSQADPLPRIARLGYGLSAGMKLPGNIDNIEIFHLDFSVDAEDYLIVRDSTGQIGPYQKFLGDIKIGRNIFGIKGDDKVYAHSGLKLEFLESLDLMWGHIANERMLQTTNGFGIRLKGLLKFITDQRKNPAFNFIADHFDLRYYKTTYLKDSLVETKFQGIEILFSNYSFD